MGKRTAKRQARMRWVVGAIGTAFGILAAGYVLVTISASTKPTANAAPIPSEAAQVITNTAPATTESHTNFDAASLLGPASTPSVQVNLSAIEKELAGNKSVTPNLNVTGAAPIR